MRQRKRETGLWGERLERQHHILRHSSPHERRGKRNLRGEDCVEELRFKEGVDKQVVKSGVGRPDHQTSEDLRPSVIQQVDPVSWVAIGNMVS